MTRFSLPAKILAGILACSLAVALWRYEWLGAPRSLPIEAACLLGVHALVGFGLLLEARLLARHDSGRGDPSKVRPVVYAYTVAGSLSLASFFLQAASLIGETAA